MSERQFPQYRKYIEVEVWYKIFSEEKFLEIKKVGTGYQFVDVDADKFPEKLRIQDMLECLEGRWEIVTAEEFESIQSQIDVP
jgi:hypothetical protein